MALIVDKREILQQMIDECQRIVFFGGAGVSTESNIPDFRSADGLYQEKYKYPPEKVVSHTFFMQKTELFYDAAYVKNTPEIPMCQCGGIIKPDVVLYEEGLDNITVQKSLQAISEADMLIIGGTSLVVYPAAGVIDYFRGKYLVVVNMSTTSRDSYADLCIQEPIGEVLGSIVVKR